MTGDSLADYLGPILVDQASATGVVQGFSSSHDGTGITRPDFVDWSVVARQQMASYNPDAVVVFLGGNDFQNMTLPGGKFFEAGTPEWTAEYSRRAQICMGIWTQNGKRRVYWLSMPPARNPTWSHDFAQIDVALQDAASKVPGASYVNIVPNVTDHGKYVDFIPDAQGHPVLIREPDGLHLNVAGSTIVAGQLMQLLKYDLHIVQSGGR